MRINEIITEAKRMPEEQIANTIRSDCAPYLAAIDNDPASYRLWRGIGKKIPFFTKNPCPVNRKPMDTNRAVSAIIDQWFFDTCGIRFRSNATFGTGNPDTATEYGNAFNIFPIGKFDYCWSPEICDMTYDLVNEPGMDGSDPELIIHALAHAGYQVNTGLKEAIYSNNEIMIHCPQGYYALACIDNERSINYDADEAVIAMLSGINRITIGEVPPQKAVAGVNPVIAGVQDELVQISDKIEFMVKNFGESSPAVADLRKEKARLEKYLQDRA